jgi:hypothetical protein
MKLTSAPLNYRIVINGLLINPHTSEAIVFLTRQRAESTSASLIHVDVTGAAIALTDILKILGVTLDKQVARALALRLRKRCTLQDQQGQLAATRALLESS